MLYHGGTGYSSTTLLYYGTKVRQYRALLEFPTTLKVDSHPLSKNLEKYAGVGIGLDDAIYTLDVLHPF